jgi:hypothetical protein
MKCWLRPTPTMFGNPEYGIRSLTYPLYPWNAIKLAALHHFDVQTSFNFV